MPHYLYIPVNDLKASVESFETLGWTALETSFPSGQWMSDGSITALLDDTGQFRVGLLHQTPQWHDLCQQARDKDLDFEEREHNLILTDPNGVSINLISPDFAFPELELPEGNGLCGRFHELSIETRNIEQTLAFWQLLGFSVIFTSANRDRWFTLARQNFNIGIYEEGVCPHPFHSPALTYFEKNMQQRIVRLEKRGLQFSEKLQDDTEEVRDALWETDKGQHVFLFSA